MLIGLSGVPYASFRISSLISLGRADHKQAPFFGGVAGFGGDMVAAVMVDLQVEIASSEDVVNLVRGWRFDSTWRM